MNTEFGAVLRDVIVLAYMIFLRVGVPLLVIVFAGKWIQRKMAESDMQEQRARSGEPYCWDTHLTAQTANAKHAAALHPSLPCWLAVQREGGGVTEECFNCPRYAIQEARPKAKTMEVR